MADLFEKHKKKGLLGLLLLLLSRKKEAAILLVVGAGASLSLTLPMVQNFPMASRLADRLGFRPARKGSAREEMEKARVEEKLKQEELRRLLTEARRGQRAVGMAGGRDATTMAQPGNMGAWDAAKKIGEPKSIRGIMHPDEAKKLAPGVMLGKKEEEGIRKVWSQGLTREAGGLGNVYFEARKQGQAHGGGPTLASEGDESPAEPAVEGRLSSRGGRATQALPRRQIQSFMTRNAKAGRSSTRGLQGQGGSKLATVQLNQTRTAADTFIVAGTMEEQTMVGAPYDGQDIKLNTVSGKGDSPSVGGTVAQSPGATPDHCNQHMEAILACSRQKNTYMKRITEPQYGLLAKIEPFAAMDQNSMTRIEALCTNKCPCECGPCQNELAQLKQPVTGSPLPGPPMAPCDEMVELINRINAPCQGVPAECLSDLVQGGYDGGTSTSGLMEAYTPLCGGMIYQTLRCQKSLFGWTHGTIMGDIMNHFKCGGAFLPGLCGGPFYPMNYPPPP